MDDVKDKGKVFIKKLNTLFAPSNKFKGEGQKLGSGADLPSSASSSSRSNNIQGKHWNGQSDRQQQEDRKKLQQERWERERKGTTLQPGSYIASTGGAERRNGRAPNSAVSDAKRVQNAVVGGQDNDPRGGTNLAGVCEAMQAQNLGTDSSCGNARKSLDRIDQSFDPFAPYIGSGKGSDPTASMFQCPVCEKWWRSEVEVSSHVDDCLKATEQKKSFNNEDVEESQEGGISLMEKLETSDDKIKSAVGVLLSGGPSNETLDVLIRLLRNLVNDPASEKYRRIRMGNPKIHETVGMALGGVELLESLSFCLTTEGDEIWAVMDPPSEAQVNTIKDVIAKLDFQLSRPPISAASGPAQKNQTATFTRKVDRKLRVFHAAPENLASRIELPDSFFEVSAVELRHEAFSRKKKLEDSQLLVPKTFREKQAAANKRKYKASIIRTQFPDGTILQGLFLPMEPTTALYEFVSSALEDSSLEFDLVFLASPKNQVIPCVASPGMTVPTLEGTDLVPTALVKFRPAQNGPESFTGLRADLMLLSEPLTSIAFST